MKEDGREENDSELLVSVLTSFGDTGGTRGKPFSASSLSCCIRFPMPILSWKPSETALFDSSWVYRTHRTPIHERTAPVGCAD